MEFFHHKRMNFIVGVGGGGEDGARNFHDIKIFLLKIILNSIFNRMPTCPHSNVLWVADLEHNIDIKYRLWGHFWLFYFKEAIFTSRSDKFKNPYLDWKHFYIKLQEFFSEIFQKKKKVLSHCVVHLHLFHQVTNI